MDGIIYLLLVVCSGLVGIGYFLYRKIFNHITIYFVIWTVILCMGEFRLINYYRLEPETWTVIIAGGLSFFLGSVTHMIASGVFQRDHSMFKGYELSGKSVRLLGFGIFVLSTLALISALQLWSMLIGKYGSISKVLLFGNLIYQSRVYDGSEGALPYVDSFSLAASLFSGLYTHHKKSITPLSIFPIMVVVIVAIAGMGRAKILIALILFLTGYFLPKTTELVKNLTQRKTNRVRMAVGFIVLLGIIIGSAEIVRSNRGMIESFSGSTKALNKLRGGSIITPSIYVYFSIHPFVLNEYMKGNGEPGLIGGNTFAPVWRVLDKMGAETYVSNYQMHYTTPVSSNTGTYLREIHADFGMPGVFIVPYILGIICSVYWKRWHTNMKIVDLAVLSHLFVIIALSYLTIATRLGYWLVSFVASLIVAIIIDRSQNHQSDRVRK